MLLKRWVAGINYLRPAYNLLVVYVRNNHYDWIFSLSH